MSTIVQFGNTAAHERVGVDEHGAPIMQDVPSPTVTTFTIPDEVYTSAEIMRTLTHADGSWDAHSSTSPAWVESNDADLAQSLGYFYGCPVGRPADWDGASTE